MRTKTIINTTIEGSRNIEVEETVDQLETILNDKPSFFKINRIQGDRVFKYVLRKSQVKAVREK